MDLLKRVAIAPWKYLSGPMTIMAFDIAPTRRSGALIMGQMKDGKIAVGLAQLWYSDIAIDEMKMASDINEWARKYHPTIICFDKYATQTIATN
jgi:hypothetical protein